MSLRVVIFGKTLLVRQPIAQALETLDFQVFESAHLPDLISGLEMTSPILIVMDADGMAREWRLVAQALGARRTEVALVLVATRFTFDDAHDALSLKVAGVIMKPFRREDHAARLLDIALRQARLRPRRSSARVAVTADAPAALRLSLTAGEEELSVKNIAEGGALVALDSGAAEGTLVPGEFIPLATLSWGDARLETSVDVVHRGERAVGVRFSRAVAGEARFLREVAERRARALGHRGGKRRW